MILQPSFFWRALLKIRRFSHDFNVRFGRFIVPYQSGRPERM
ncbi:hypothetical protein A671_04976 [Salmonella enterica subsp. enterica serovar Dublin str. DG22]|uniref:Uncharacterized protein n=1 Tax=Salmonella enterica subsp. enterica serovar Dublin str. UC16 TaxID=1192688 RepID=M7R9X9_SALDU|nr:hypothetical protein A670_04685 [Salmonella enterica subsp. enterica serovar Dublin str. UC16]EPI64033.1 hypothetical protein A671_04976 [Salmonella enterica subsp. enterica serovar Dublin str. DG22]